MNDQRDEEFLADFNRDALPELPENPNLSDPVCGFFPDMTAEEYHGDPVEEGSLSNSGIKILLAETPLDFGFQHPRINPAAKEKALETVAGLRGDLVHQLALGKGRGYAVIDAADWRTKAAQEFRAAALEAGETPVLKKAFEAAQVMAEVVVERIKRALDGADYLTEVAIVWREETPVGPIYLRGRLDVWCPERLIILDPKITAVIGDGGPGREQVQRHAVSMGWDRQAALYERGVSRLMPEAEMRVRFGNLLVKPDEPFTSRLLWPSTTMKRSALHQCLPALETFARCMAAGRWPGYPDEGETLELPSYEERRRLAEELGE